jgi:hypothetical protein
MTSSGTSSSIGAAHTSSSDDGVNVPVVTLSSHHGVFGSDGIVGVIDVPSPPKVFRCPACNVVLDERCFAKHIDSWLSRDDSKRLRSNQCPGFPSNHHFLRHFHGHHKEQVRCLHATVRAMLNPGCNAAQFPQGSGNHLRVEAYFRSLSA